MKVYHRCRSLAELYAAMQGAEHPPAFVYFWGHTPKVPGRVDASCLSNWFPAAFEQGGVRYPTTEHFMMAEKARLFGDEAMRTNILAAEEPEAAKTLGRQVADFDHAIWETHRFDIVVTGNQTKFEQHGDLGSFLQATGDKILVEASPVDRIWGIGMDQANPQAHDPNQWRGLNLMGFALMEVRSRLA